MYVTLAIKPFDYYYYYWLIDIIKKFPKIVEGDTYFSTLSFWNIWTVVNNTLST